jgi:hypothetical protein
MATPQTYHLTLPSPNPQDFPGVAEDMQQIQRWGDNLPFYAPTVYYLAGPNSTISTIPQNTPFNSPLVLTGQLRNQVDATDYLIPSPQRTVFPFFKTDPSSWTKVTLSMSAFAAGAPFTTGAVSVFIRLLKLNSIGGSFAPFGGFPSKITGHFFNAVNTHFAFPTGILICPPPQEVGWWVYEVYFSTGPTTQMAFDQNDSIMVQIEECLPQPDRYTGNV